MRGLLIFGWMMIAFSGHAQRVGVVSDMPNGTSAEIKALLAAPVHYGRYAEMGRVRLELRGVYIESGLLWLVFRGINRSAIDFRPATMRIAIRDKHAFRRRALQERSLPLLVGYEPSVLRADSAVLFCYGLTPRVPGRRQEIFIEWMERNGDRRLLLHVPASAVLTARKIVASAQKN